MRITHENITELIAAIDELDLDSLKDAAETWNGLQDEEKTEEVRDEIRDAREELEGALESTDFSTLCQIVHGKHKGK